MGDLLPALECRLPQRTISIEEADHAVLYIIENPNVTTEFYDEVRARLKDEEAPRGGVVHVAAKRDGGGLLVVEVWESEADRERWA